MTGSVPNWYRELGVPQDASADDIKMAFRRRARLTHTDLTGGDGSSFARVSQAYEVLSDPAARAAYDRELGEQALTSTEVVRRASAAGPVPRPTTPFGAPAPSRARTGTSRRPGPQLRPARWLAVLVGTALAGNLLRFTGIPALVFGFTPGERMLVGGRWWNVPAVDAGLDLSTLTAVVIWGIGIAVLAAPLVAAWTWRVLLRPVPAVEKVLLLAGWVVTASAWEILTVRGEFWKVTGWVALAWLAWAFIVTRVPDPTTQAGWDSFGVWVRQLRAARRKPGADVLDPTATA